MSEDEDRAREEQLMLSAFRIGFWQGFGTSANGSPWAARPEDAAMLASEDFIRRVRREQEDSDE